MSCIDVELVPGEGFTESMINAANPSVIINNVQTTAHINLTDGTITTATAEPSSVTLMKESDKWTGYIVPQTASSEKLITVRIDGEDYTMSDALIFKSGYRQTFTMIVSRIATSITVSIIGWQEDPIENRGTIQHQI